jgi:hypothetical protein
MGTYQIVMKKSLSLLALALVAGLPSVAGAQQAPPSSSSTSAPNSHLPTEAERAAAKAAALSALSADHRAKILAIVDRVNSGQLTDFHAAEQQIDAVLSPEEAKALLADRAKGMHATEPDPSADAGRYLLRHAISPEKLRELRLQIQQQHQKPQ